MSVDSECICYICHSLLSESPDDITHPKHPCKGLEAPRLQADSLPELSATPCGHVFHKSCILQWFKVKLECPNCRRRNFAKNSLMKIFLPLSPGRCKQCKTANDKLETVEKREVLWKERASMFAAKLYETETALKEKEEKVVYLENEMKAKEAEDKLWENLWKVNEKNLIEKEKKRAAEEIDGLRKQCRRYSYRTKIARLDVERLQNAAESDRKQLELYKMLLDKEEIEDEAILEKTEKKQKGAVLQLSRTPAALSASIKPGKKRVIEEVDLE